MFDLVITNLRYQYKSVKYQITEIIFQIKESVTIYSSEEKRKGLLSCARSAFSFLLPHLKDMIDTSLVNVRKRK